MNTLTSRWLLAAAVALLAACNSSTELYGGLSERDANDISASLNDHGIPATKLAQGKQLFAVNVPQEDFSRAVTLLRAEGLPNNSFSRMGDIFKKDGMISTPTEERARFLHALSQELENTLSQIDGVVLARVHPVLSERVVPGEPALPSSCSVLIKHVPGWDTTQYEARVRKLVVASIPGLADAPEKVAVVFVPSEGLAQEGSMTGAAMAGGVPAKASATAAMEGMAGHGGTHAGGAQGASSTWQGWLIGIAAVLIGIGGPSAWLWWHRRPAAPAAGPAPVTPLAEPQLPDPAATEP